MVVTVQHEKKQQQQRPGCFHCFLFHRKVNATKILHILQFNFSCPSNVFACAVHHKQQIITVPTLIYLHG